MNVKGIRLFFALLSISSVVLLTDVALPQDVVYIIVNPSLGNVSLDDVRRAYKGELSKINGRDVILYELPVDNATKKLFVEKFLGMDMNSYRRIWLVKLMGGGTAPKVATEEEMIKNVSLQDGAIGYVSFRPRDGQLRVLEVR